MTKYGRGAEIYPAHSIQGKTPSASIKIGGGKTRPKAQAGRPKKANGSRCEIVRRDYPDRDHPKLLEHIVDQRANAAATAVRKSHAGGGG
ncbi:hypothetical protein Q3C01_03020 [Bradyrhizobium sp. UFLA05-109]